jgi:short-subunit dehydrogenase
VTSAAGRGQPFRWSGRRVLITGGSSGIGKRVAADLLRKGAHVGIVAEDPVKLSAAESELKELSSEVWSHPCDISALNEVRAMALAYREKFAAPDVLINNAGYAVYYAFEQMPLEEIQRLFQVNLVGAALVTRAFLPDMIRAGGGDVVMVASIAGRVPMTPCGVYSASKHGLVTLAELLKIEAARFNVRVQVVCPGRVETDFFSHESFQRRAPRPEASRTITLEAVSQKIVDAVEYDRFLTYVPSYYAVLAWIAAGLPLVFRPIWHRFMAARVEALYRGAGSPKPD